MRILLDTSAYSAFMRGHDEIRAVVRTNEDIFLNSVVVGELMAGFIKGGRRKKNEEELRRFLTSPRVSLVDVG
jgi:predicted nucleic acid-binding protein